MRDLNFDIRARDRTGPAFDSASRNARGLATQMEAMRRHMDLAATAAKAFAAGIVIEGLGEAVGFARDLVQEMGDVVDVADRINVPVEAVQQLRQGFQLAGVEAKNTDDILVGWSRRLGEAAQKGGPLAELFKANGVSITDSNGKLRNSLDLLGEYANLVQRAGSEQEALQITAIGIGRANADAVLAFKGGAQGVKEMLENTNVQADANARKLAELGDLLDIGAARAKNFATGGLVVVLSALKDIAFEARAIGDAIGDWGNQARAPADPFINIPGAKIYNYDRVKELTGQKQKLQDQANLIQQGISADIKANRGADPREIDERDSLLRQVAALQEQIVALQKERPQLLPSDSSGWVRPALHGMSGPRGPDTVMPGGRAANGWSDGLPNSVNFAIEHRADPYLNGDPVPAITGELARVAYAIKQLESRGGDYSALGPVTKSGDRAYGAYQVMGNNIGPWTQAALGRRMTPSEFLADPSAQDAVFADQFTRNYQNTGSWADAASIWHSGSTLSAARARGATDGYMRTSDYVAQFEAMRGAGAGAGGAIGGYASDPWGGMRTVEQSAGLLEMNQQIADSYAVMGQIGQTALQGIASALSDGKIEGREWLQILLQIGQQALPLLAKLMGGGAPGGGGLLDSLFGGGSGGLGPLSAATKGANSFLYGTGLSNFGAGFNPVKGVGLFADGGWISGPGGPTADQVPAMLSNGEFVVNAAAARKNAWVLEAMNAGHGLMHRAEGGWIPGAEGGPELISKGNGNEHRRLGHQPRRIDLRG